LGEDLLDAVFLSEVLLADIFDLNAVLSRQFFSVLPDLVAKGFGESGVVEDTNMALVQPGGHAPSAKQIFGSVPKINMRS
jgi:hypothetical protein